VLTDPEPIGIGITSNPTILNCSFDTAILTASASGGFLNPGGDYQYLWNDGTTESTLIDALIGVTYSLTVTDQGGNSNTQSFTVLGPDPIPFDPNINPERYTVVWTKIGDPTFNQSGISINQLTAGFYEYQITDQNECRYDNFATPIEIVEPLTGVEVFELVNEHVDNTVFQGQEGILEVSVINNTGAFSIQWFKDDIPFTPPTGSTDTRLINLEAGRYTLELIKDTQINNISCNGFDDGNITVIVIGGVTPYTYAWQKQGDPDFIRPDDSTINELSPGQYTVTITDDSGSSIEITSPVFDITQPDPLVIQLQGNIGVSCPLGNDGAIDISIEGGTPPYNILWSNGRDTEDIDTLEVGDYTVSIIDDNGCTAQTTISVINQPNQITIQEEIINQVSTFQGTDGSIELRVNGGQQPYTFSWVRLSDNTPLGNTNQINNLIADTYMVTITDAIGCVISPTYQISQPDIIVPTITPLLCNADCNAAIQIEVNEGEGNFTYLWSTGATTDTITGLCAGIYTVTVSGFPNGDITRNYEIIDPEPLRIELDEERFICLGQTATLAPPSIDPNASYNWSADNGFTSNQAQINVNQSGIYTLLVTNSNGCTASDTITVNEVDSLINPEFLISSQVFTNEKFVVIDVTNPMPDQIEWIIPEQATIVNQNQDLIELYFELPGEYEISMSVSLGDCTDIYSQKVLVIESNTSEENPNQQENIHLMDNFL